MANACSRCAGLRRSILSYNRLHPWVRIDSNSDGGPAERWPGRSEFFTTRRNLDINLDLNSPADELPSDSSVRDGTATSNGKRAFQTPRIPDPGNTLPAGQPTICSTEEQQVRMLVNESCQITRACTSVPPTQSLNATPLVLPIRRKRWPEWSMPSIVAPRPVRYRNMAWRSYGDEARNGRTY